MNVTLKEKVGKFLQDKESECLESMRRRSLIASKSKNDPILRGLMENVVENEIKLAFRAGVNSFKEVTEKVCKKEEF